MLSLWLLWTSSILFGAEAGHYYCRVGGTIVETSDQHERVDHLVLPWKENAINSANISHECKWQFEGNFSSDPIMLLRGFDTSKVDLSRRRVVRSAESSISSSSTPAARIQYRFVLDPFVSKGTCPGRANRDWRSVDLDTVRVFQISKRADLIVQFTANSSGNPHDTPSLQIQLMEPGFCSKDVVYFEHSCYSISSARRSLKAELTAICRDAGLAQLASFNSSSALQNFVEKSQRTRVGTGMKARSKTPLNLTQPVRIGLLHDRLNDSIFYLSNSKGELELKPLVDSSNLYYNVRPTSSRFTCGCLRLAQTADGTEVSFGVVEFVSCSESLPALLSFRDTARNCCCGCSARAVLSQIESAESQATPSEMPPSSAASVTPSGTSSTKTTAPHRSETSKAEKVTPPSDSTDACRKSTDVCKRESYNFFIPFVIVLILLVLVIIVFVGYCMCHNRASKRTDKNEVKSDQITEGWSVDTSSTPQSSVQNSRIASRNSLHIWNNSFDHNDLQKHYSSCSYAALSTNE
ncbi:hypothetical protein BOX15_Mlig033487g1 [Macrostomum lignano]|uniref:CUB domain-containing protein n=1 Tax=Macrostomum lignano TaxID=282301 RepID=A0A267G7V4_9PLAT|nr:hypothetical protein BOX15_Mlig033487g1 [Macrostomum lignano]